MLPQATEGRSLSGAMDESLASGLNTAVALELSHHKAAGLPNWGKTPTTVKHVWTAPAREAPVALDVYPYHRVQHRRSGQSAPLGPERGRCVSRAPRRP